MDKTKESPLTQEQVKVIDSLRKFQERVEKIETAHKEPPFVRGTIEPTTKK